MVSGLSHPVSSVIRASMYRLKVGALVAPTDVIGLTGLPPGEHEVQGPSVILPEGLRLAAIPTVCLS
jgi:hypothetical protein